LIQQSPNILNVVSGERLRSSRTSLNSRVGSSSRWCRRSQTLIKGSLRHTELLSKLSHLLAVGSESYPYGAKVEYSRPLTLFRSSSIPVLLPLSCGVSSICWGLLVCRTPSSKLNPKSGCSVLGCSGIIVEANGATADRTGLLAFKPALEAAKMQNMPTGKLLGPDSVNRVWVILGIPELHVLTAYNARVLSCQVLLGSVGISIHLLHSLSVSQQSSQSLDKVP
jgi:hypothetical protein